MNSASHRTRGELTTQRPSQMSSDSRPTTELVFGILDELIVTRLGSC
jgi:hypothetical protein